MEDPAGGRGRPSGGSHPHYGVRDDGERPRRRRRASVDEEDEDAKGPVATRPRRSRMGGARPPGGTHPLGGAHRQPDLATRRVGSRGVGPAPGLLRARPTPGLLRACRGRTAPRPRPPALTPRTPHAAATRHPAPVSCAHAARRGHRTAWPPSAPPPDASSARRGRPEARAQPRAPHGAAIARRPAHVRRWERSRGGQQAHGTWGRRLRLLTVAGVSYGPASMPPPRPASSAAIHNSRRCRSSAIGCIVHAAHTTEGGYQ
ncbi:hypothetical protein BS78_01G265800 [Paspalum vaginatum]|nr:hypothetical protein BS78_01G265800 [Paspalum vaginatum]